MGADPYTAAAIGGANLIGGIMGQEAAREGARASREQMRRALGEYYGVEVPTIEEQEVDYILPEFIGEYTPEAEDFIEAGPSEMEGISTDPRLQQAQMDALQTLSDLGETGLTPGEAAALRQIRRQSASEEQARQGAILQEMQRRGVAGGGSELAARLQSAQSSADRMSQEGDRLAQMAQQRALQSISQAGELGGNIRRQEFSEQADIARAADQISRFNTANQLAMQQRNVQARNQAAQRNLEERQRIAEQQAATQNVEQERNKQLLQQRFQNQLNLAQGRSGIRQRRAEQERQAGLSEAQGISNIASGIGGIMGGMS